MGPRRMVECTEYRIPRTYLLPEIFDLTGAKFRLPKSAWFQFPLGTEYGMGRRPPLQNGFGFGLPPLAPFAKKTIIDFGSTSGKYKLCESMSDNTIRFISPKDSLTRTDETTRLGDGRMGTTHRIGIIDEELVVFGHHEVVHYALKVMHLRVGDKKVHEKCIREMMAFPESHSAIIPQCVRKFDPVTVHLPELTNYHLYSYDEVEYAYHRKKKSGEPFLEFWLGTFLEYEFFDGAYYMTLKPQKINFTGWFQWFTQETVNRTPIEQNFLPPDRKKELLISVHI
ncbi:hypothetical protein R1sor_007439 [Riccia sorocarpa]|uniref:Uncharacterized protein n=1 Tax=Riccia sorocarpa TaxID=122646 RepID=A0ABD3HQS3_9MARC